MRVSILIVSHNSEPTLAECLMRALATSRPQDEIVLVDNASSDASLAIGRNAAKDGGRIKVVSNEANRFYAPAANRAAELAQGDALLFLNPDAFLYPLWRERFEELVLDPPTRKPVGAVGPVSDGVMARQFVGLQLPHGSRPSGPEEAAEMLGRYNGGTVETTKLLVGFCLFVPRSVWESAPCEFGSVGPLETSPPEREPDVHRTSAEPPRANDSGPGYSSPIGFHPDLELGCDDLEYSWRLRRNGCELLIARDAFVSHRCRVSFGRAEFETAAKVSEADRALLRLLREAYGGLPPPASELWGCDSIETGGS